MNKYEIYIDDIFEKKRNKHIEVEASNVYLAHKQGLDHTNALREEITKITRNGELLYTFKNGFFEE